MTAGRRPEDKRGVWALQHQDDIAIWCHDVLDKGVTHAELLVPIEPGSREDGESCMKSTKNRGSCSSLQGLKGAAR